MEELSRTTAVYLERVGIERRGVQEKQKESVDWETDWLCGARARDPQISGLGCGLGRVGLRSWRKNYVLSLEFVPVEISGNYPRRVRRSGSLGSLKCR